MKSMMYKSLAGAMRTVRKRKENLEFMDGSRADGWKNA